MHLALVTELGAVEEHPVEVGLEPRASNGRFSSSEDVSSLASARASRSFSAAKMSSSSAHAPAQHVVARDLQLGGVGQQVGDGRQEHGRGLLPRPRARTKRPTAWAKNSGVEVVEA